jgi:hypothetical protein
VGCQVPGDHKHLELTYDVGYTAAAERVGKRVRGTPVICTLFTVLSPSPCANEAR